MSLTSKTKWGIAIPQVFTEGPVDMAMVQEFVTRAEALGYQSLWVLEPLVVDFPYLEPLTLLCYAAALTKGLRLGTSVLVTPLRHPALLAKALGSLDQLSEGRLIVGVGVGQPSRDYPAFGVSPGGRVQRLLEGLAIMKALWTQPSVTYKGEFWQLEGFTMEPKPVQKPHPPVWMGAEQPAGLRRSVHYSDGWMGAGASSTAQFKECVSLLYGYLEQMKRDPATFTIAKRVYIAVDRNRARAEQRVQQFLGPVYRNLGKGAEAAVWGDAAECVEKLGEIVEAGAQLVALNPMFAHLEHLELLAKEVIPKV